MKERMEVMIAVLILTIGTMVLALIRVASEAEAAEVRLMKSTPIKHEIPVNEKPEVEKVESDPWEEERILMARVVQAEAGTEPFVGKVAVAATILNRAELRGMTISEVVFEKNQYASPAAITEKEAFEAVDFAKENRDLFPRNMFYFRTNHFHTLAYSVDFIQIGQHFFSLDSRYEKGEEDDGL